MPLITDGKGRGFVAGVDGKNRLDVHAQDDDRTEVVETGKAWSISFDNTTPAGNDDYFLYMKNTGSETYIVTDFIYSATADTTIEVRKVTGTPTFAGSEVPITPVSLNLGSAVVPTGTYSSDSDITGLVNGGVLFYLEAEAGVSQAQPFHGGILMPPGTALALLSDVGAGPVIKGTVNMFVIDVATN